MNLTTTLVPSNGLRDAYPKVIRGVALLLCLVLLGLAPASSSRAEPAPGEEVLTEVSERLERQAHPEVPLALWQARAMLEAIEEAELAIMNGPGVRTDIEPGPLTRRDLRRANPFNNHLVLLELPGEVIARGVRHCFRHRPLQLAGAVVEHAESEALRVLVDEEQIEAERIYRVVTVNYVAEQQHSMFALRQETEADGFPYEPVRHEETGELLRDLEVYVAAARRLDSLGPEIPGGPGYRAGYVLGEYPASRVADGDTMRVAGLRRAIRFQGIDTEEEFTGRRVYVDGRWERRSGKALRELAERDFAAYVDLIQAGRDRPQKYGTPMAEAATAFVQERLAPGDHVRLELDRRDVPVDVFNRWLAYVFYRREGEQEWRNLCVELVRQGYTPYYFQYGYVRRFHDELMAAMQEAKAQRRGIWAAPGTPGVPAHYPDYPERLANWHRSATARLFHERLQQIKPQQAPIVTEQARELERMDAKLGDVVEVFTQARSPLDATTVRCNMALRLHFQLRFESEAHKQRHWRSGYAGEMLYVRGRLAKEEHVYYVVPEAIIPAFPAYPLRTPVLGR